MVQLVNRTDFSQYNTMIGDYFANIPEMVKLSTLSFFQVFRPIPEYDAILCEFIPDVRTMFDKVCHSPECPYTRQLKGGMQVIVFSHMNNERVWNKNYPRHTLVDKFPISLSMNYYRYQYTYLVILHKLVCENSPSCFVKSLCCKWYHWFLYLLLYLQELFYPRILLLNFLLILVSKCHTYDHIVRLLVCWLCQLPVNMACALYTCRGFSSQHPKMLANPCWNYPSINYVGYSVHPSKMSDLSLFCVLIFVKELNPFRRLRVYSNHCFCLKFTFVVFVLLLEYLPQLLSCCHFYCRSYLMLLNIRSHPSATIDLREIILYSSGICETIEWYGLPYMAFLDTFLSIAGGNRWWYSTTNFRTVK